MEPQSKGVVVLRWLGFLPGAFFAAWLSWLLVFFGNKLSMRMMGINSDGFLFKLFVELMSGGAMGAAFVYAGSRIAPTNRKVVSFVLAAVAILIAGFSAFPAIVQQNWWAVVSGVAMCVGAWLIVYQFAERKLDLDSHGLGITSLLSYLRCSAQERKFAKTVQQWYVTTGLSNSEAKKASYLLLDICIDEAEKKGLRTVSNLGDRMVNNEDFASKRLSVGLTIDDILNAWDNGYIWVIIQQKAFEGHKLAMYSHFVEEGLSSKEAVKKLRCLMPYFGDPEASHPDYQGEDADIYFEFRGRFDKWRNRYSSEDIIKMAKEFPTYNAMIRYYIEKGEI